MDKKNFNEKLFETMINPERKYEKIDIMINSLIPMGKMNINKPNVSPDEEWEKLYEKCYYF